MKKYLVGFFSIFGFLCFITLVFLGWSLSKLISDAGKTAIRPIRENTVLTLELGREELDEQPSPKHSLPFLDKSRPSVFELTQGIREATKDHRVKGIFLQTYGQGFSAALTQELRAALLEFKKSGKFLYAYTTGFEGGNGATMQYYLASAADQIWIMPLGSWSVTGMAVEIPFAAKGLADWHLKVEGGRREEYKGMFETATRNDFSPAYKDNMQRLIDSLMNRIVNDIAKSRGLSPETVRSHINSAPYHADQAVKEKLTDHSGYRRDVCKAVKKHLNLRPAYMKIKHYLATKDLTEHVHDENAPKIGVIYATGTIVEHADSQSYGDNVMDAEEIAKQIRKAVRKHKVKALVLRIDSGGGSAIGSEIIGNALDNAAKKIPVIVSMSGHAASGGYWIAAKANKIVAQPGTVTGSIGVFSGKLVTKDFWEHYGIHWGHVQNGDNALLWSSGHPFTEEGYKKLNASLDHIYNMFLTRVAQGRGMNTEKVRSVAKGQVWTGEQAVENGLADALGGLDLAIDLAKEAAGIAQDTRPALVHLPLRKSVLEKLLDRAQAGEAAMFPAFAKVKTWLARMELLLKSLSMNPRLESGISPD